MFKVDAAGNMYEFGKPIKLTEEDRQELQDEIIEKCKVIDLAQRRGTWAQGTTKEVLDAYYQVENLKEDDEPTYTEQLEACSSWQQVMALGDG